VGPIYWFRGCVPSRDILTGKVLYTDSLERRRSVPRAGYCHDGRGEQHVAGRQIETDRTAALRANRASTPVLGTSLNTFGCTSEGDSIRIAERGHRFECVSTRLPIVEVSRRRTPKPVCISGVPGPSTPPANALSTAGLQRLAWSTTELSIWPESEVEHAIALWRVALGRQALCPYMGARSVANYVLARASARRVRVRASADSRATPSLPESADCVAGGAAECRSATDVR
jgi:hypothetical protein